MNKISIVCSNYNSDLWIGEYLNYVNNQTSNGFDIIFVDACSTDSSLKEIKNFKFKQSINSKVIECNSRIGIYAAWNMGIKVSTTEYVMNYNTDDMLFDYALETYEKWILKDPDADIIFGPYGMVKTRNINNLSSLAKWPDYSHDTLMYEYMCGPFQLIKKKVFSEIGYFDESFVSAGDYEMVAKMSKMKYKFRKITQCIGCFYDRNDSISNRNKSLSDLEIETIQQKYKEYVI
jgi:glycosyltransferase involved in cell wall biosynthesis